jgi:membrane protease YdiL (CAAX protease family)
VRRLLEQHREQAWLSRRLATIDREAPLPPPPLRCSQPFSLLCSGSMLVAWRPCWWCRWSLPAALAAALPASVRALVLLLSYLAGLATPDPRLLQGLAFWIVGNIFLTVAAEEGFFRGLLQR